MFDNTGPDVVGEQTGGIIGVPSTPASLTLEELHRLVPHFRPDLDVQVGDWLIVTSVRRGPLLNPLMAAWEQTGAESPPATTTNTIPLRAPLRQFAVPQLPDDVQHVELAPLSSAKHFFTWRKRVRRGSDKAKAEDVEKTVVLYLHVRLGLLTATPPLVFGGTHHNFRALARVTRSAGGAASDELIQVRFLSETGVAPVLPPWLSNVEAEAAAEWRGSRLETTFNLPFPASQTNTRPRRAQPP